MKISGIYEGRLNAFAFKSILWGALFVLSENIYAGNNFFNSPDSLDSLDSLAYQAQPGPGTTTAMNNNIPAVVDEPIIPEKQNTREHTPHRATIYSAVLPGLGQAYNGKYWKVPIIYAGGVGLFYGYKYWNNKYKEYKNILFMEEKKLEKDRIYGVDEVKNAIDKSRNKREYMILYCIISYSANIIDALVDAYFFSYDISDKLTLNVNPTAMPQEYALAQKKISYGLKLSINF